LVDHSDESLTITGGDNKREMFEVGRGKRRSLRRLDNGG
jgi:hypothetical protein